MLKNIFLSENGIVSYCFFMSNLDNLAKFHNFATALHKTDKISVANNQIKHTFDEKNLPSSRGRNARHLRYIQ